MSSSTFSAGPRLSGGHVRTLALEAGFAEAGLVALPHPNQLRDADRFAEWVNAGRAATMNYLTRMNEHGDLIRARVAIPFPWARSAIICFANYHSAQPLSTDPATSNASWIARYAWSSRTDTNLNRHPSDYHKVLLKRMKVVEACLHEQFGDFESRAYVDTGPLVERSLATAAGLGWTGKNTCLIHPKLGSFGFLAVLLTSLEAPEQPDSQQAVATGSDPKPDAPQEPRAPSFRLFPGEAVGYHDSQPAPIQRRHSASKSASALPSMTIPDRCGSCRRCLDACPTNALFAPYQMDASRCISYLTIEHRGPISPELMEGMGRQVFGCDICQDVCPWNRKVPITADPDLAPRPELVNPTLEWLAALDEPQFQRQFNGSPIRRTGFQGLRRNVAIAMGNSRLPRFAAKLEEWAIAADEGLSTAACWALEKLSNPGARY